MHIQESLMHTLIMEFMGEGRYIGENESEVCERVRDLILTSRIMKSKEGVCGKEEWLWNLIIIWCKPIQK